MTNLIGAAPPWTEACTPEEVVVAEQARVVATRASGHFNKAMRSYYFGLAVLTCSSTLIFSCW